MLASASLALSYFADPWIWLWIIGGVVWGLLFGLLPGVGSLMGMALFLPFVFKLDILQAMPLLVALSCVGFTAGSITAVLIGIPGDSSNLVTMFDGYPMTQRGEGARGIGAAITASLFGGVVATFYALLMIFAIVPVVMSITSSEMVFIILIGLAFISVLGKGSKIKGFISGGVGLLLSLFGLAGPSAEPRFIFDIPYMYEGWQLVPVTLGLFAVPPLIELAMQGGSGTISQDTTGKISIRNVFEGSKDVFRHKFLCIKCSVIGYFFGILPGVGAQAAVFLAYGHAKSVSKHPEEFGNGNVEGVIAPESCNNAKESGSWLTTMALGVPGSAVGALGLGALIMLGLNPGPSMITNQLDLALTFLAIVAIANVLAFAFCFPLAPYLAKIARIPSRLLVSVGLVLIFAGTYTYQGLMQDVVVLLIFALVGLTVKQLGFNAGSLLLGYILGSMFEDYLFVSIQSGGFFFFLKPASLVLLAILVIFLFWSPLKNCFLKIRNGGGASC